MQHILIINLGPIRSFVLSTGAIQDIHAHHMGAHVTLLTDRRLAPLATPNPHIDDITFDSPSPWWHIKDTLRKMVFLKRFDYIYDLTGNSHTAWYYRLTSHRTKWCGIVPDCTYYHNPKKREVQHSTQFLADQLRQAGLNPHHRPDISYAAKPIQDVMEQKELISKRFAVIIPGSAKHEIEKRWPHYDKLILALKKKGWQVALCGSTDEEQLLYSLSESTGAVNLTGLSLPEFINIFKESSFVIGNDTGPTQLAVAAGCKGVAIYGNTSDIIHNAPNSATFQLIHTEGDIATIELHSVLQAIDNL